MPVAETQVLELPGPHGPARAHIQAAGAGAARSALVLGHGAGGGVSAPDLLAAQRAALGGAVSVALIEQPYRVAGRRSPPRAPVLDAAWVAAIAALRDGPLGEVDLIVGGRSSGARVACRTAGEVGAHAVLCLAFPLQPPQHRRDGSQAPSRLDELESVSVPVLVVQGDNDPFGMPPEGPNRRVIALQGDHSLRSDPAGLERAVGDWLGALGLPAA